MNGNVPALMAQTIVKVLTLDIYIYIAMNSKIDTSKRAMAKQEMRQHQIDHLMQAVQYTNTVGDYNNY